jgi:hypothetical protein
LSRNLRTGADPIPETAYSVLEYWTGSQVEKVTAKDRFSVPSGSRTSVIQPIAVLSNDKYPDQYQGMEGIGFKIRYAM